ncbi:MAG: NADH-quinone oxidoreductase subunit C [Chloroflexi bacterium]|nr:NADH-quinone oxidoreductase subunit C [Chloroflexota bacterium]
MTDSDRVLLPRMRTPEEIQPLVAGCLRGLEFEAKPAFGELVVTIPAASAVEACRRLKSDPDLRFDYLRCLSGVDLGEGLEVVYHLFSVSKRHKMALKAAVAKDDPRLASVVGVWKGADWHEREAAEMFGIDFEGHPHLKTLLLIDGFEGHPLLKSFTIGGIPSDEEEANVKNG